AAAPASVPRRPAAAGHPKPQGPHCPNSSAAARTSSPAAPSAACSCSCVLSVAQLSPPFLAVPTRRAAGRSRRSIPVSVRQLAGAARAPRRRLRLIVIRPPADWAMRRRV
ncbi:hypothetical protein EJB05_48243, partial [Eragrostis curvula]